MKREEVVHRAAAPLHHFIGSIHQSERTEKTSADKRITYIIYRLAHYMLDYIAYSRGYSIYMH